MSRHQSKWNQFVSNDNSPKIREPIDNSITYEPQKTSLEMHPEAQGKLAITPNKVTLISGAISALSKVPPLTALDWASKAYTAAKLGYATANLGYNVYKRLRNNHKHNQHPPPSSSHNYVSSSGRDAFPEYDETYQYRHYGYSFPPPEKEYYNLPTYLNPQASQLMVNCRAKSKS